MFRGNYVNFVIKIEKTKIPKKEEKFRRQKYHLFEKDDIFLLIKNLSNSPYYREDIPILCKEAHKWQSQKIQKK